MVEALVLVRVGSGEATNFMKTVNRKSVRSKALRKCTEFSVAMISP